MTDFTRFFGKGKLEPLKFTVQQNVNYLHEIIFLSSYLHDATFETDDFVVREGILTLPLKRDCWEFWTRLRKHRNGLPWCRSVLTISGIRAVTWSRRRRPKTTELTSVFVGEDQFLKDNAHLVLHSYGQKLKIDIRGDSNFLRITLKDLEKPRWSAEPAGGAYFLPGAGKKTAHP